MQRGYEMYEGCGYNPPAKPKEDCATWKPGLGHEQSSRCSVAFCSARCTVVLASSRFRRCMGDACFSVLVMHSWNNRNQCIMYAREKARVYSNELDIKEVELPHQKKGVWKVKAPGNMVSTALQIWILASSLIHRSWKATPISIPLECPFLMQNRIKRVEQGSNWLYHIWI